jgi:hypothetical protein
MTRTNKEINRRKPTLTQRNRMINSQLRRAQVGPAARRMRRLALRVQNGQVAR